MDESILNSVKKLLGIEESYNQFDADILMHINSVLMILRQLNVGPQSGYEITGAEETWSDFLGNDTVKFQAVKTYLYMRVRMMFDPPTGSVAESTKNIINELEWRLNVEADYEVN